MNKYSFIGLRSILLVPAILLLLGAATAARVAAQTSMPPSGELLLNIRQVSAGSGYSCAVTMSGEVACWGNNSSGQLAIGTDRTNLPVMLTNMGVSVRSVSTGFQHTCAVTIYGGVKCWGKNGYGQLGDGTLMDRYWPTDVTILNEHVQSVSVGAIHTCALTMSGSATCWGGIKGTTNFGSGLKELSAGYGHTCVLTAAGGIKCWGYNDYGQLGNGTTTDSDDPVDVVGLSSGVRAISAGGVFTCAITDARTVKCWGHNDHGQLGDGTTVERTTPVDVNGLADVEAISTGFDHACAITEAGGVKCWGDNTQGQLGDGTTTNHSAPRDVVGLQSGIQAISAGVQHTCATTHEGGVKCWGNNYSGQLGNSTQTNRYTPQPLFVLDQGLQAIQAGASHSCALTHSGAVKCWGNNSSGQLGDGTTNFSLAAVNVYGLDGGVRALSVGDNSSCVIIDDGTVRCWGENRQGQLGDGTTTDRSVPVDVMGLVGSATAVSVGGEHACALIAGAVQCWGNNTSGQLGDGTTTSRLTAAGGTVNGYGYALDISAGGSHTCAVTASEGLECWGNNTQGQVGDDSMTNRTRPVQIAIPGGTVKEVSAGRAHTCAVTSAGGVMCWGDNFYGQVGADGIAPRRAPLNVEGLATDVQMVAAGGNHSCVLTTAGMVKCWGDNFYGQLGDGTTIQRAAPGDVLEISDVWGIFAGLEHTCALTSLWQAKCWGANVFGQLGVAPSWTPSDVITRVGFDLHLPLIAR